MLRRAAWKSIFAVFLVLWVSADAPCAGNLPKDPLRERTEEIDKIFGKGGASAAKGILPYLKDRELGVRSYAMKRLVDLGPAAVDPLVGALEDEEVRWLACGALINIGNESVGKTVLALKHKNPAVRSNALFILKQLDARSAVSSVRAALSDPDPSVQVQAVQAVAQFGGEDNLRLVMGKVDSLFPSVRDAAMESLPKFGEAAIPVLASSLAYGSVEVRVGAVRALGTIGTRDAIAYVGKGLSDPSPMVRYYACLALGEKGDPAVLEDLGRLFNDPDPDVREAANDAFARMPEAGSGTLFRFLREGSSLQKIGAATAVRKARYRPAVPLLLEAMRDRVTEVKVSAVAALIALSDPSSVEGLVGGLKDPGIRWICVIALRQFGDTNLVPLLRRSDDQEIDHWKQLILEGMGDRVLAGCLDALKKEEDVGVRISSLCTLKQVKDTRAILPVIRLLGDEKIGTIAGFVLSQMGDAAVGPLLFALRDENPSIRARAATALGEIGCASGAKPLRPLLADPDLQVRKAAEEAIRKIGGGSPPVN